MLPFSTIGLDGQTAAATYALNLSSSPGGGPAVDIGGDAEAINLFTVTVDPRSGQMLSPGTIVPVNIDFTLYGSASFVPDPLNPVNTSDVSWRAGAGIFLYDRIGPGGITEAASLDGRANADTESATFSSRISASLQIGRSYGIMLNAYGGVYQTISACDPIFGLCGPQTNSSLRVTSFVDPTISVDPSSPLASLVDIHETTVGPVPELGIASFVTWGLGLLAARRRALGESSRSA